MAQSGITVLVSSGYYDDTLAALRGHWQIHDIPEPDQALAYLRQAVPLPHAVAIGHVASPERSSLEVDMSAQDLLQEIHALDPQLPVVVSTRLSAPTAIVELIQQGAFDYIVEPPRSQNHPLRESYNQQLVHAIGRAVQWRETLLENQRLKARPTDEPLTQKIIGRSGPMVQVVAMVRKVAPTPATVLLTGASGTGKEVVAQSIHQLSPRHDAPFLVINCGAMDDNLLASELLGHVRGAFTGADRDHHGLIRQAAQGTLMLDELESISPAFQTTLLRVLEQRRARPVGGTTEYDVRCRFIACTNMPLETLVRQGRFREDLFYRLHVFHIRLPELADRVQDIAILAQHLLTRLAGQYGKPVEGFTPTAMRMLEQYPWPGNVRQLRNVIERAVILCDTGLIHPHDLLLDSGRSMPQPARMMVEGVNYHANMQAFEKKLLEQALGACKGNRSQAARLLGIKRTTLHSRLKCLAMTGGRTGGRTGDASGPMAS